MSANHYYIDEVNVIIDSYQTEIVTITGSNMFEPNRVKNMARKAYSNSKIASVILTHRLVTLEEYKEIIGQNQPWLGNI